MNKIKKIRYFDYSLLIIIMTLLFFGLVMLYSTSSYTAESKFDDAAYYLKKQAVAALIGLCGMFVTTLLPTKIWEKLAPIMYLISLILCGLVLVIGKEYNGSKRWLNIGGVSVQPSEIAKVCTIIFLAYVISRVPKKLNSFKTVVNTFLLVIPVAGVVAISNLSTAVIIVGIAFLMLFVASPKYSHFVVLAIAGVAFAAFFLIFASYRVTRIKVWLNLEDYTDEGYQILQGLYAIGSGGLFGKGLGQSMQKLGYVPEAQNDMIFTIICEELGLFGAVCVILIFILLLWRCMVIANNASTLFGSLLVIGIMSHIALQVILNIAVVTNSIPNTGITLPFISYGGTSISILLTEMGLALGVSRGIEFEA